jgi:hypothetical protein
VAQFEITRQLSAADVAAVGALIRSAEAAVGQELITEHRFHDAAFGGGRDFAGPVATTRR